MRYLLLSIFAFFQIQFTTAQLDSSNTKIDSSIVESQRLKVFLDCADCNDSYFRRNLNYLHFVNDAKISDVHIYVTKQKTAAEGFQYGINFIGKNEFADLSYKLKAVCNQGESNLKRWNKLIKPIQAGLLPYISRTEDLNNISVQYSTSQTQAENSTQKDPWNYWVFLLDLGGELEAEKSQNQFNLKGSFNAKRITEKLKLRTILDYEFDSEQYTDGADKIVSDKEEIKWSARSVHSINKYWSFGLSGAVEHSTYYNIDASYNFGPAVEYNLFPWDISDRKMLTLAYQIKPRYFQYLYKTTFGKMDEVLWDESLKLELTLRQPWGEIESVLEGKHYLHNFDENSLSLYTNLSVKIVKGFSIFLKANATLLNDQRYIAATEQTRDEILLQQRKQKSPYEFDGTIGLRYSFGSIYNNVVNHRM